MSEQLNSFNQILSIAHGNTLGNKNKDARDKREKIKVDIEPEEFEDQLETMIITSSEICTKLTSRLKEVFKEYVGCRPTNNPKLGIDLVFDPICNNGGDTIPALFQSSLNDIGSKATTKEEQMIARFNGINYAQRMTRNGVLVEEIAGAGVNDDAIDFIIDTLVPMDIKKESNNAFRKSFIHYESDPTRTHNRICIKGIDFESACRFIYGDKSEYVVKAGAPINNVSYSGIMLQVTKYDKAKVKKIKDKYIGRTFTSDGLF